MIARYGFRLVDGSQGSIPWGFIVLGILSQIIMVWLTRVEKEDAPMEKAVCQFRLVFSSLVEVAKDIQINIVAGLLLPS